jgi:hypothetical protein
MSACLAKTPLVEHVLALVALLILAIPAGALAFFAVCLGTVAASSNLDVGMSLGMFLGGCAWVGVSGSIIYFAVRAMRRRP